MENMELQMTTPELKDCTNNCAYAKMVTDVVIEIKNKIGWKVFTWVVGGVSATFLTIVVLIITLMINFGGNLSEKIDIVNANVNNLRVESVEKVTRLQTLQDQYNIKVDAHIGK